MWNIKKNHSHILILHLNIDTLTCSVFALQAHDDYAAPLCQSTIPLTKHEVTACIRNYYGLVNHITQFLSVHAAKPRYMACITTDMTPTPSMHIHALHMQLIADALGLHCIWLDAAACTDPATQTTQLFHTLRKQYGSSFC